MILGWAVKSFNSMILTAKDLRKAWHRLTFRSLSQGKILCYTSSMSKNLKKKKMKKNKHGLTMQNSFSVSIIHNASMGDHFSFIVSS